MSIRPIREIRQTKATIEGAGVHLQRAFGFADPSELDPFLLFDDFRNEDPEAYRAGFPWHPHRGIETITYVLAGTVAHGDSLGNRGALGAGDVQWMTAGRGILHQEMPQGDARGRMHGFQLWANLPSAHKMTAPRYQDVKSKEIPEITDDDGTKVRVICGSFWGKRGPVDGIAAEPRYLDVTVPPLKRKTLKVELERHAFAYVFEGSGRFRDASAPQGVLTEKQVGGEEVLFREPAGNRSLVLFGSGDEITVEAGEQGIRFLLVSGKPIKEPVAWYGPIVMNTQAELKQAAVEGLLSQLHSQVQLVTNATPTQSASLTTNASVAFGRMFDRAFAYIRIGLVEAGAVDHEFINAKTAGFAEFIEALHFVSWGEITGNSGVSQSEIERAVQILCKSKATREHSSRSGL